MPSPASPCTHLVLLTVRLVPEETPAVESTLLEALTEAFGDVGPDEIVFLHAMGRQDAVILAPTSRIERVGRLNARLPQVKTVAAQYCYSDGDTDAADLEAISRQPLSVVSFLRLDERLALRDYRAAIASTSQRVREACRDRTAHCAVMQSLGWPDLILLASGDCPRALTEAALDIWETQLPGATPAGGDAPPLFAFSRTYSVLATPTRPGRTSRPGSLLAGSVRQDTTIPAPRVEFRMRPGRGTHVLAAARGCLETDGIAAAAAYELGHEDLELHFAPGPPAAPAEGHQATSAAQEQPWAEVNARRFLADYWHDFMGEVHSAGDAYCTQLCLGLPVGGRPDRPATTAPDYPPALEGPTDYFAAADGATGTRSVADSLRTAFRAINWAAENEAVRLNFLDLYGHFGWLEEFLHDPPPTADPPDPPRLEVDLRHQVAEDEAQLCSRAFQQRLAGSYYGVIALGPEPLMLGVAAVHKVLLALWAITAEFSSRYLQVLPQSYWLISHGESPMALAGRGGHGPIALPMHYALLPDEGSLAIVHETAHTLLDALDEDGTLQSLNAHTLYGKQYYRKLEGRTEADKRLFADICCDLIAVTVGLGLDFDRYMDQLNKFIPLIGGVPTRQLFLRAWIVHRFVRRCEARLASAGDPGLSFTQRLESLHLDGETEQPLSLWSWTPELRQAWGEVRLDAGGNPLMSREGLPLYAWEGAEARAVWYPEVIESWQRYRDDLDTPDRQSWYACHEAMARQFEESGHFLPPYTTAYDFYADLAADVVHSLLAGPLAPSPLLAVFERLRGLGEHDASEACAERTRILTELWEAALKLLAQQYPSLTGYHVPFGGSNQAPSGR